VTQVSIVTPFLNSEAHLAEAIASVRSQTVPDWELLLVDDGSTDGSPVVARTAADADERIRLIVQPAGAPHGAAAARNAGIAAARGKFVAFLDADDLYEPHMLATTLDALERHPDARMVFGQTRWWHPDGGGRGWVETTDGRAGRLHRPPTLLREIILLEDGHVPCTCSVIVRRSAVEAVGGFDERFRLYEDQTLWAKLFLRFDVFVTPVCLSRYRQHASSISALATAAGDYDRMAAHPAREPFLEWLGDIIDSEGGGDPSLVRALRLARSPYRLDPGLRDRLDRLALAALFARRRLRRWLARHFFRLRTR
jgi:hypothetical protein